VTTISPQTASVTSVASSATSVQLFAAAGTVRGRTIFNESTAVLYVAFAATASTSAYTVQVAAGGYYELPGSIYGGVVSGIWASANGNARLTSW
jgi:hypothetical protein